MICVTVSAGVLFRKEHASISARTASDQCTCLGAKVNGEVTSQPIDGPSFKLFQADFGGRGKVIEIQPMWILLLLVERRCELLLFMMEFVSSFRIDTIEILPNHCDERY